MIKNVLSNMIYHLFEDKCGDNQARKPLNERHGLVMSFALRNHFGEDGEIIEVGYRNFDLVIYGAYNYVSVYSRFRSHVAPADSDGIICGDYVSEEEDWELICHHDSCWRGAISGLLFSIQDKISTTGNFKLKDGFISESYGVLHRDKIRELGIETPQEIDDWEKELEYVR